MCGIAGIFLFNKREEDNFIRKSVEKMCDQMHHRGPDAYGIWQNDNYDVVLGHKRLSILDLNSRSNQPMSSVCKRYFIVFNGEIYNFNELRLELEIEEKNFKTNSDTEVLLKMYIKEGKNMLNKLRGMFAFAIYDQAEEKIFFARDPYGIKPLYIAKIKNGIIFSSQVKSLLASGLVSKEKDKDGELGFWLLGSVPEPKTWFKDIKILPSGHFCEYNKVNVNPKSRSYFNISEVWRNAPTCTLNKDEVQKIVRKSVKESLKKHLISDVKIATLLSGGIDSATIVALMSEMNLDQVTGITVCFDEFKDTLIDETPRAKLIAKKYKIKHHIRNVDIEEFINDLPKILSSMDQPSIDGINTWYACKAASELGIKVVVSGIGGDELFFGYPSFHQIPFIVNFFKKIKFIPFVHYFLKVILILISKITGNFKWKLLNKNAENIYLAYWIRRGLFTVDEINFFSKKNITEEFLKKFLKNITGKLPIKQNISVGQMESTLYMRNQLLRDADWASMYHSVELRTPLVDTFLLKELSSVLESFSRFKGKKLLANSPNDPLDEIIINSSKTGFSIPISKWIKKVSSISDFKEISYLSNKNVGLKHLAFYLSKKIYD